MKKVKESFEKYNYAFLIVLSFLFVYSRYKYLGEVSYYLHIDELETAYESMSLALFGTDSSLTGLHLVFPGQGSEHGALLVYLGAVLMKIKGGFFSLKLFRLLSVAGGCFCLVFSYLTAKIISGKKIFAFFEAVLVTTLPVFFITNRTGVEDYFFLYIVPAAVYFLLRGCVTGKMHLWLISGFLFAGTLLSGGITYIAVPVFLVAVSAYCFLIRKSGVRELVTVMAPVVLCLAALIIEGNARLNIHFASFMSNSANIKALLWDDHHPFNISSSFGTIYVFSIPIIMVGAAASGRKVIVSAKKRTFENYVVVWIFLITIMICSLMKENADIQTSCSLFFALSLLITEGIIYISENLRYSYIIVTVAYLMTFGAFTHYYYENFNSEVNNSSDHDLGIVVDQSVGEAFKATAKLFPDKEIAIITDNFAGRNLLLALYAGANPADYRNFKDKNNYAFGNVLVNPEGDLDFSGNMVYIINQSEHQDTVDEFTSRGWGVLYLKEYTLCFAQ